MPQPSKRRRDLDPDLEFLVVDDFLQDLIGARALKTGLELGLIDHLIQHHPAPIDQLAGVARADEAGTTFLLELLAASNVVEKSEHGYSLSAAFRIALRYRDLLETKLDFAGFLAVDYLELFTGLVADPAGFMKRARLFQLFDYQRAQQANPANYERTRAWMKLTTTLTRYEARACLKAFDFGGVRRMLDVGGNSGEFALQACRRHPALQATVMDLPLVCDVGQDHLLAQAERSRVTFLKGDVRQDPLPGGHDLISFKSMLHDWPEDTARAFLTKAAQAVEPGGTILIFERAPLQFGAGAPPFSMLPTLLFFRSYRPASVYENTLQSLGFADVRTREVALEVPFFLTTATKPKT